MFQENPNKHTEVEKNLFVEYSDYFTRSPLPTALKLSNFAKYCRRQDISRFLAKNELFKLQLDIPGSIIECGCYAGGGLMTFAQLSSIYEPHNHQRRVYGFDTFSGFANINRIDKNMEHDYQEGDLNVHRDIVSEIQEGICLHDKNRAVGHIRKTDLIIGNASETIPKFLLDNKHLVVSFLYLDFDLYEPTKIAIESFLDRMPKGSVIAFDELNTNNFPGETVAVLETIGIKNLKLRKTIFDPYISFAIID